MGIKLSAESDLELPAASPNGAAERLRAGFVLALGGLVTGLQRVLLPHLLLCLGIFVGISYGLYLFLCQHSPLPQFIHLLLMCGFLALASAAAAAYSLLIATLYGLKNAAIYAEDFFYTLFQNLKTQLNKQIDAWDNEVAKQQAKVLVNNKMSEVVAPLKQLRLKSVSALLGHILLGFLVFISRWVFIARITKAAGTTIRLSSVFASRATLVGALFLNMRWLATLGIWLCYAGLALFLLCALRLVW